MIFLKRSLLGLAMYLPIPTIKRCLYRMSGARIGKDVYLAPNVVINCTDMKQVRIGDNCSLGLGVWIRCKSIDMKEDVKISGGACIIGNEKVTIGKGCYIGHNALLDCWETIVLENCSQISPGAIILTHDSSKHYISGKEIFSSPTIIRENSYIGAGAIILPGIEIGRCAIIGAGAVVTKNVAPCTTVVGSPAISITASFGWHKMENRSDLK